MSLPPPLSRYPQYTTPDSPVKHTFVSVQILCACVYAYYIQVNKKFCELKGGNIGIVEKAQETRFGKSPKYNRYIGIAS